jgi:hypothetical protein
MQKITKQPLLDRLKKEAFKASFCFLQENTINIATLFSKKPLPELK